MRLARDINDLNIPDAVTMKSVSKLVTKLIGFSDIFWSRFKEGRGKDGRFKLDKNVFFRNFGEEVSPTPLGEAFYHIDQTLTRIEKSLVTFAEEIPEVDGVLRRVRQIRFNLDFVVEQSEANYVYWLETTYAWCVSKGFSNRCFEPS